tara:strand:- start:1852 stop:2094 length:243 start_codon:yes stop_codon:yes gene_type:complete
MSIELVAEKITGEKRKEIMDNVMRNKDHMDSKYKYHPTSLPFLFAEWHRYFPNVKQSISCVGCRKAVVRFWTKVANYWEQ